MSAALNYEELLNKTPDYVTSVASTLIKAGHEAYLVGGSVRDLLLGKTPQDYDVATNAYPEVVEKLFEKSIPTGAKFGTMLVLIPDANDETQEVEVTTYRSEADYYGGRWPAKVEFTKTIDADLARRDFTINAIAVNLNAEEVNAGKPGIVDPFAGQADLAARIIRAVGNPVERFTEDGLRQLRACRLAANLGFGIEPATFAAIKETLAIVDNISMERVRDELVKLLVKSPKPSVGIELLRESGLLAKILPELLEGIDVTQPEFHSEDVYAHSLRTVDAAPDEIKLAALLHDIGKPRTMTKDSNGTHFYGHDLEGAKITQQIMKRLKFSNAEIERTSSLVRWHMFYYPNADWRKQNTGIAELIAAKGNSQNDSQEGVQEKPTETIIYLMRHAETDDSNSEPKRVSGQNDIPLNQTGRNHAEEAAAELQGLGMDAVYSSDLARAQQTAEIIAAKLGLEVKVDSRFRERNFGELQGLTWDEFSAQYPYLANHPENSPQVQKYLPGGETISQVESRAKIGLFNLMRKNHGKSILLVTHSGVIRILRRSVAGEDPEIARQNLDHCGYVKFTIDLSQIDPQFLTDDELELLRQEQQEQAGSGVAGGWSDAAVRRFIRNVGSEDLIDDLMKLRIADAAGNPKAAFNPKEIQVLSERIAEVRAQDMALKVTDLDVTGHDLMELGIEPGQEIGKILAELLEEVTEDPLLNEKTKLLALAKEIAQRNGKALG